MRLTRYLFAILSIFGAWQLLSFWVGNEIFPSPWATLQAFTQQLPVRLAKDMLVSTYRVTLGLGIAICIAHPLGLISGRERCLDQYLTPIIQVLYPIPKIIFLPIIFILLGIGDLAKISLIALKAGFQILVISHDYSKGLSQTYFDSMRTLGGGKRHFYFHILWPSSLPSLFTAIRINLGTALSILFISESYATQYGIGAYIMDAFGRFNTLQMLAGTFGMAILGVSMFFMVNLLEKVFCPWHHLAKEN